MPEIGANDYGERMTTPVEVHIAVTAGDAATALMALITKVTGNRGVELTHSCPQCGSSQHGRLVTNRRGLHVSLSRPRSGGPALVALCESHAIGVDVEAAGAASFDGFDDVALHPEERCVDDHERTRLWTRKEALLKAHGTGLAVDPRTVWLSADGRVLEGPSGTIVDVERDGQRIAVAVTPPAPIRLVWD